jgi:subtilisin family serine protease
MRFAPFVFIALSLSACASAGTTPASTAGTPSPATPPTSTIARSTLREAPRNWHLLDASLDGVAGISALRAERELLAGKQPRPVTVAVIDIGVDTAHPDIRANLWSNPRETAGNRADDDRNGYVDDIRGWNFIGGPDGRNINEETLELTRLYRWCTNKIPPAARADTFPASQRQQCPVVVSDFERRRGEIDQEAGMARMMGEALDRLMPPLRAAVAPDTLSPARVLALRPTSPEVTSARALYLRLDSAGVTPAELKEQIASMTSSPQFSLNPDFYPRGIVGDNPADVTQRVYGNADVTGPDPMHGTHVAGIIGAVRNNGIGIDGIAPAVRIMGIRAVPNGDERDKDVANSIRYAVDNGAQVINLSFGKGYSPHKSVVDDAARYADSKNVLIVHAAGNDGEDVETSPSFPTPAFVGGGRAQNWIEVGASSWRGGDALAAPFSNYGRQQVDIFAPGEDIYSAASKGGYERASGTSMAAPVVSGVAALLMSYYPDLSAAQVKRIILDSAARYLAQPVRRPGSQDGRTVPFGTLSTTGGIVNVYNAVKLAETLSRSR